MAKFLRLHVKGIRSVGDEDHNVHKIEFLSPCTLISGPNGTGKTTTIEALMYITTGIMPTISKQNFIHSTDVARKTRVDASVALEFVDVKGRVCTAIRRLVATAGAKSSAQAEEHTLTVKYPDGTTNSLSSKVCDFNKAILHHLGVPRAIFKYVIFCHQEDSTWPLSGPKELKVRFDDIFQLTKFVKAQERMRKIVGDFKKDLATNEVQKRLCETHLKDKLIARKNRDDCVQQIVRGKEMLTALKEQKNEAFRRAEEMKAAITKLENVMISITKNQAEKTNLEKQLSLMRVEPYCGTEEELDNEIRDLREGSGSRDFGEERARIERKILQNNNEKQQLAKQKKDAETLISTLKAESLHRASQKEELEQLEAELRSEVSMDDEDPFELEIRNAVRTRLETMTQSTKEIVVGANEIQKELQNAQEAVTKIEVEVKTLFTERKKLEREVDDLKVKIKQGENATSGMKDLLRKEENIRKDLDELPELNENALKECKRNRELIQKELDSLKKRCVSAEKNSEREKEAEKLKESIAVSRKKLAGFDKKHADSWDGLFGRIPSAPWAPGLQKIALKLKNDKKTTEGELRELQLNVQKLETMQQQHRKYEEKLTSQELQLNEEIFDMCSCEPEDVAVKLAELRKKLKKARKDLAPISAKVDLYDSWIEDTSSSGCCPLCDRDFKSKKEISEFSQKLQDMTLNFPNEQEELEKAVLKMEEEEGGLVKAEGQARELAKIMKELKEVREKNKTAQREMKEEKKNLQRKEEQMDGVNAKLKFVEALQSDVGVMDQLWEQVSNDTERLETIQNTLESMNYGEERKTYSELREEAELKEREYRKVVQSGEEIQKTESERNRLQAKLNELGSHRVSLGEAAAQTGAFAEQIERKKIELEKCLRETERKREEDLPDAKFHKEEITRKAAAKEEERRTAEMEVKMKRKWFEQKMEKWDWLMKNVAEAARGEKRLVEQDQKIQKINEKMEENQQRQKRFEEDLRTLNGSQDKQLVLEDQRQRMRIEKKIRKVEAELSKLAEHGISEEQIDEMKREYQEQQNEIRLRGNEEVKVFTQIQEYEKQQKVADAKLATKECQRAEKNYRDAILEVELLRETIEDLNKYRQCLDVSLIQFHTEKMAAVNVIIDELWRKVYNSTDITTIRIRSDAKSESSARNRTYDYNVMMVQESGAEVEMRGRCSAGQKMLASLLIRIALAEVFGGLCSMIALDEPTTNLDEFKVDGMASVIADLIEARRGFDDEGNLRGREMQMVVITHDERLVNKLTTECRPDYIYVLGKDEHGISFLTKRFPNGEEVRVNSAKR